MKCECKKDFQQKIEDHVKKGLPEGHENYSANLEGYGLGFNEEKNSLVTIFMIQYSGIVMVPKKGGGLKKKSIKTFIAAKHCPFCGEETS